MRKIILVSLILFLASGISLHAQVDKDKFFVAGTSRLVLNSGVQKDKMNGQVDESSKQSYFAINFQPKMGYTILDNFIAGLFMDIDIYSSRYKDDSGNKYKGTTFTLGPFARYYIPFCEKMIPYAEAQLGFGIDNYKDTFNGGDDWNRYNESVFTYRLGGGATLFFNDMVGADMFIGFSHEAYKHSGEDPETHEDHTETVIYNEIFMQLGVVIMIGK